MPSSAAALPTAPPALARFIRKSFTAELCNVDFTQALPAVAALAALDDARKRDYRTALRRMNVEESSLASAPAAVQDWVRAMQEKNRKAEALYTQAYIGLRRWALINEMRLLPFDHRNCVIMLDALYPATYATLPTPQLTAVILNAQRDAFLKYIEAVGKHGRSVLKNLENQSKREGDANGWPVVYDILERYLKQSHRVLDACASARGSASLSLERSPRSPSSDRTRPVLRSSSTAPPATPCHARRPSTATGTSRGISPLGSPSSSALASPPSRLRRDQDEWLARQRERNSAPAEPARPLRKSRSTLSRLAQEFRRIKSRSADSRTDGALRAHSALDTQRSPPSRRGSSSAAPSREPSLGPARDRKHSRAASVERAGPTVTIDDAYREHLIQEAKRNKATREKRQHSPTHFKMEEERRYTPRRQAGLALDDDDDERFFFVTDAATRRTPARSQSAGNATTLHSYASPAIDLHIAELAA